MIRDKLRRVAGALASRVVDRLIPASIQERYTFDRAHEWDVVFDRTGEPNDGPYAGLMYKWAAQVGPVVIRRAAHDSEEAYQAAMRARTREEAERVRAAEDAAIRRATVSAREGGGGGSLC